MATTNNRVKKPQAMIINGVDAGGKMSASLQFGYDQNFKSDPDGMEVAMTDRAGQFVRGTIVTQDWIHAVELLTAAVGTYVFYERKSGVAAATGYIKHTITNPVIYGMSIEMSSGDGSSSYAEVTLKFECKAADETKGVADMWTLEDAQAAPTHVTAARGGIRIISTVHGTQAIAHVTSFNFGINMNLSKACNDSDVGYTCVDAEEDNKQCSGSIGFQDASIASSQLLAQTLVMATRATLIVTVRQSGGAADKTITIAGVDFGQGSGNSNARSPFTGYSLNFDITNDTTTPLTLAGANPIIAIADVV